MRSLLSFCKSAYNVWDCTVASLGMAMDVCEEASVIDSEYLMGY